ncbi:hypothetical protein ABT364_18850 [Massilia sp. SR12]
MVDATYAPLFRYFGIVDALLAQQVFEGLPRISAWRTALAERPSVKSAVMDDYASRFLIHLRDQSALMAQA